MKKIVILICAGLAVFLLSVGVFVLGGQTEGDKDATPRRVLLLGTDRVSQSTDTILLLSLDDKTRQISFLQIPRDLYLRTESGGEKINSRFSAEGIDALVSSLERLFGVPIDGYAVATPEALAASVDALGGIRFRVPFEMRYEDPAQGLSISVPKGERVLNGEEFLSVWRYRSGYADGDLGRLKTQRELLLSVADRLASRRSAVTLWNVYRGISPNVLTNLSKSDIISLCLPFCMGGEWELRFYTLPGDSLYQNGTSFFVMCRPALERMMRRIAGESVSVDRDRIGLGDGEEMENIYFDPNTSFREFSRGDIYRKQQQSTDKGDIE